MKVLFAVRDEKVSLSIVKKYQKEYKEIISYKNVYYFNAILKELQRDKTYDRVVIDEELEEFTSTSYEEKDKFIFNKLDNITDEASNSKGKDIPIILICSERRTKSEDILVKMFGIGIYNAIIGNDRSTDEVCRLINAPRSKKDAKLYYKIYSKDVDYDPENEDDVSEEEMQHILSYFKRLGRNEDKYVEGFRKIVSQYSEKQMKVIIAILPLHVKSVLEEASPEYQRLVAVSGGKIVKRPITTKVNTPTSERLLDANRKKTSEPIVVPSSMDKNVIKKITIKKPIVTKLPEIEEDDDDIELVDIDQTNEVDQVHEEISTPKRRGRPPKKKTPEELEIEKTPKRRGRPPKKAVEPELEVEPEEDIVSNILPGIEDESDEDLEENVLPNIEEDDDLTSLPGLYDDEEEEEEEESEEETQDDFFEDSEEDSQDDLFEDLEETQDDFFSSAPKTTEVKNYGKEYDDYDYTNYNNLLSSDRKVIAFVGTSKNGTSFIVNNVAKILSESGINTAILDATKNRNSYYIYNNNDDQLRNMAANSIENLIQGRAEGMQVSRDLTVYVGVPGEGNENMNNVGPILETLAENYSAVLIDCDFDTPLKYFENAQEIFLVQSMDVLTIQPFTAFLKELKNRNILEQQKIKVIINKAIKLGGVSPRQIVGGMANYNNPEMSVMTELFDRNLVVPIEIPFDVNVYARYLEGLADCDISTNKYPKEFQAILKKLASVIYPLLPGKAGHREKPKKGYQYQTTNGFSNSVNNTLNNMKRKY